MSDGSADAPERAHSTSAVQPDPQSMRATLIVVLCLGAAILGVVRLAQRIAPSDAELVAIVLAQADSVTARRALHALIAREVQRNRRIAGLDEAVPHFTPADRAFLAEFRPHIPRRDQGEPR